MKFVVVFIMTLLVGCHGATDYTPQVGDLVFQISKSSQSKAIQLATKSQWSHVGVIVLKDNNVFVAEAIKEVSLTPLDLWIKRGEGSSYVVKRLRNNSILDNELLCKETEKYLGKKYDFQFNWSDDKQYCSELVWKIFKRSQNIELSTLDTLGSYDFTNPIVYKKLSERYGDSIPYNEPVIAPSDLFESKLLIEIYIQK